MLKKERFNKKEFQEEKVQQDALKCFSMKKMLLIDSENLNFLLS
jgi:hypothetical protein